MKTTRQRSWLLAVPLCLACAGPAEIPDVFATPATAAEETTPLGGEALGLRKRELGRALDDMRHHHATLQTLREHGDRSGMVLFSQFLDRYMGEHLEPLLRSEWQSRHPELMAVDANLRLAQADVLMQMRSPGRMQKVVEEIEQRYAGRESMLVEFPLGDQTTLAEALHMLRDSKWRGRAS